MRGSSSFGVLGADLMRLIVFAMEERAVLLALARTSTGLRRLVVDRFNSSAPKDEHHYILAFAFAPWKQVGLLLNEARDRTAASIWNLCRWGWFGAATTMPRRYLIVHLDNAGGTTLAKLLCPTHPGECGAEEGILRFVSFLTLRSSPLASRQKHPSSPYDDSFSAFCRVLEHRTLWRFYFGLDNRWSTVTSHLVGTTVLPLL